MADHITHDEIYDTVDRDDFDSMIEIDRYPNLALLCWNRGVTALGPNRSGVFIHLIPVFGAAMAIGFLGETPRPYHGVGMIVVVAGVALATTTRK